MAYVSATEHLPRFIAIKGNNGRFLIPVATSIGTAELRFTSPSQSRLTTHEVLYNSDDDTFIIRAANGHFWTRLASNNIMSATLAAPPRASESTNRFKLQLIRPNLYAILSAFMNFTYLRRQNMFDDRYQTQFMTNPDENCFVEITNAENQALVLPRFLAFKGDNDKFMLMNPNRNLNWLQFDGDTPAGLRGTYRVEPLVNGDVIIFSLQANAYWRNSVNPPRADPWIWADATLATARSDRRCHFEPQRIGPSLLAIISKENGRYCKRFTDFWVSCLQAQTTNLDDLHAHIRVADAANSAEIFDVHYLLALASVTEQRPLLVGSGSQRNPATNSLPVTLHVRVMISQRVSNTKSFSNSTTLWTSVNTSMRAGIPLLAEGKVEIEIGVENTFSVEWGRTVEEEVQFETTFIVEGVLPGHNATVNVIASQAQMKIPFMYKSREVALDGRYRDIEERIDGMFEGVTAYKIEGEVHITGNQTSRDYKIPVKLINNS